MTPDDQVTQPPPQAQLRPFAMDITDQQSAPPAKPPLKVEFPAELDEVAQCPSCSPHQFFESIYESADGDASRVPWADCRPNPVLIDWLNREACHLVRPGSRAAVVGCGLGDDLAELTRRGYDAIGLDVSTTAIRWASRRHPQFSDRFVVADLLSLPGRLVGRFDLAVEVSTIQSVHPSLRKLICGGIAKLIAPRGAVMVLARARDDEEALDPHDGPPWPLTRGELLDLMRNAGLCPHGDVLNIGHPDHTPDGTNWLLGTFVRC